MIFWDIYSTCYTRIKNKLKRQLLRIGSGFPKFSAEKDSKTVSGVPGRGCCNGLVMSAVGRRWSQWKSVSVYLLYKFLWIKTIMIIAAITTVVFLRLFSSFWILNTKWNQLTALVAIAVYLIFMMWWWTCVHYLQRRAEKWNQNLLFLILLYNKPTWKKIRALTVEWGSERGEKIRDNVEM